MFDEEMEEFELITMTDEEGVEVEFCIIDNVTSGGKRYLLVIESDLVDDEEAEATILKEISIGAEDVTYSLVEEDEEFNRIAELFSENNGEYDIEVDN